MVDTKQMVHYRSRLRWLGYGCIGVVFGIFDYYFQQTAQQDASILMRICIIYGIWLIPLVPIAVYEVMISRSEFKTALACVLTWSVAIIGYYLYMAISLILVGTDSRPELYIGNRDNPYFWTNVNQVFQGDISGGIVEWIALAIFGGSLLGFIVGCLCKVLFARKAKSNTG